MQLTTEWGSAWLLSAFLTIAGWLVLILSSQSAQKKVVLLTVRNQARQVIVEALRAYSAWCSSVRIELIRIPWPSDQPLNDTLTRILLLENSPDSSRWHDAFEEYAALFPNFREAANELSERCDRLQTSANDVVTTLVLMANASPEDEARRRQFALQLAEERSELFRLETSVIQMYLEAVQDECLTELSGHRPDRIHPWRQVRLVRSPDGSLRLRIPPGSSPIQRIGSSNW